MNGDSCALYWILPYFCFLLGGREAISAFHFWRIASCFENRSIGFQRHSCFEVDAFLRRHKRHHLHCVELEAIHVRGVQFERQL